MGLDMFLMGDKFLWTDFQNPKNNRTEDGFPLRAMVLNLGYWRLRPNLHAYIVQTFAKGVDEGQRITLLADDIRQIIAAIKDGSLPYTDDTLLGPDDRDLRREADLITFEDALKWLEDESYYVGKSVYYHAV